MSCGVDTQYLNSRILESIEGGRDKTDFITGKQLRRRIKQGQVDFHQRQPLTGKPDRIPRAILVILIRVRHGNTTLRRYNIPSPDSYLEARRQTAIHTHLRIIRVEVDSV